MKTFLTIAALGALAYGYSGSASAAPISGSEAFLAQTNDNGQDLSTRTTFTVTGFVGSGTGNFQSAPPPLTAFTTNTFNSSTDIMAGNVDTSFALNVPGYYSFLSDHAFITNRTATAFNLFITGTLTPGAAFSTFDNDTASLNIGFTRTGNDSSGYSTSASITLASPALAVPPTITPPSVPEPATMALIGAGLMGLGLVRRRKA